MAPTAAKKRKPWKKKNPASKSAHSKLSIKAVGAARTRAKRAGRRYPNLVDNMWATKRTKRTKRAKPAKRAKHS